MDKEPPVKHTIHEVIHNLQENKEIPRKMKKELDKWGVWGYNSWTLENRPRNPEPLPKRHIDLWKNFLTNGIECVTIIRLSARRRELHRNWSKKVLDKSKTTWYNEWVPLLRSVPCKLNNEKHEQTPWTIWWKTSCSLRCQCKSWDCEE